MSVQSFRSSVRWTVFSTLRMWNECKNFCWWTVYACTSKWPFSSHFLIYIHVYGLHSFHTLLKSVNNTAIRLNFYITNTWIVTSWQILEFYKHLQVTFTGVQSWKGTSWSTLIGWIDFLITRTRREINSFGWTKWGHWIRGSKGQKTLRFQFTVNNSFSGLITNPHNHTK